MDRRAALKNWFVSENFRRQYDCDSDYLGSQYNGNETVFKIWAPTASDVWLNLFRFGSKEEAESADINADADFVVNQAMERCDNGIWTISIFADLEGIYYTYSVTVDGRTKETPDPYAKASGVNGVRSMVVDFDKTHPDGWKEDKMPDGIDVSPVIYELHIKDFSNDSCSGVSEEYRGKYLAFTQADTSLYSKGKFPTCMAYLKQLGITHVHLLPCFDFGSVDESRPELDQFNWGYDPVNYFVPEGSYATDAKDGHVRIREFKQMVMALHKAGIGVIMDMVFNHTYDLESPLQKTVPDYYYRTYSHGEYSNGSACGNDTASERHMFRRYMVDCVCHWAREYHIDGFRFDLMALHDVNTMNEIRHHLDALPNGQKILMYGEPWSAAPTAWDSLEIKAAIPDHLYLMNPRIAIFCDRTRDDIKGDVVDAADCGYVNGDAARAYELKYNVEAAVCAWCDENETGVGRGAIKREDLHPLAPSQIISYVSSHDDWTLWDKLVVSSRCMLKKNITGKIQNDLSSKDYHTWNTHILQMNKMAAGIIFTCLGTPFFLAGEEFGRTKSGCSNSYNLPANLNQLDWQRAEVYKELISWYRFLIKFRKKIPIYQNQTANAAEHIKFIDCDGAVIGFVIENGEKIQESQNGDDAIDQADLYIDRVLIFYNPYDSIREVLMPSGRWNLVTDGVNRWNMEGLCLIARQVKLLPKSVTILKDQNI